MVTLTLRNVKGTALTWEEVDGNFTNLNAAVLPTGGAAGDMLVKNSATDYDWTFTDRAKASMIKEVAKNVTATSIAKGTPVYQVGVVGNTITVAPADAADPAKMPAIGVLGETLAADAEGELIILGDIRGVNTSAFASGDAVYVAAGGGYTNVKPTNAAHVVQFLGIVIRVHTANGSGFVTGTLTEDQVRYNATAAKFEGWTGTGWVDIATGVAIDDLSNVTISTATTDDVLVFNGTAWVNSPIIGDISAILDDINGV